MSLRQSLSHLKSVCYRRPKEAWLRLRRWGPKAYFRIDRWKHEMEQAAWHELATEPNSTGEPRPAHRVWFMTGANHWYQTAFCAWSLQRQIGGELAPQIIDDGTLTPGMKERLRVLFPRVNIESREEADSRISALLPEERFPHLHRWRRKQILFRKLVDIHAGSEAWRLFLDSDMLFTGPPREIMDWLDQPRAALFQTDCAEAYGYSRSLTESLTGYRLLDRVNIGIFALNGPDIDWEKVDRWLQQMEKAEGSKYNVTQCITTMLISGGPSQRLDADRYLVFPGPGRPSFATDRALIHFVADAKPYYFSQAWPEVIAPLRPHRSAAAN